MPQVVAVYKDSFGEIYSLVEHSPAVRRLTHSFGFSKFTTFAAMFRSLSVAIVLVSSVWAIALPQESQCDTSSINCCDNVSTPANSSDVRTVMKALRLDWVSDDTPVGTGCSSGGIVSVGGGTTCQSIPVCCEGNSFDGLIGIGCLVIPITI
ncbi:hypothetical protein OBBRIDRAFT_795903 [Obba rivulosa]|uniref:Hydrophobin n=1 Tax=Obba rivulosa TaxID=1052685 RepID=A0A8E2ASW1_9APHY|nr:hypothetical protein OBBRIDRAFT_795903 [Obba rivulosa]